MKITVHIHNGDSTKAWTENYDAESVRRSIACGRVASDTTPENFGERIVEWFNSTLRPREKRRTFVRSEVQS